MKQALAYARMGWRVLPVHNPVPGGCSCGRDCGSPGKHPRTKRGVKDATTDKRQIEKWKSIWGADANIAVATGHESGLVVLDVDAHKGGLDSLYEQVKSHGPFDTLTAITGGGGRHYFFQHPDRRVKNAVDLWPGVDVRADGGYVVAPPSEHASGNRYEWVDTDVSIKALPDWLLDQLETGSRRRRSSALRIEGRVKSGKRNDTLTRMAGAMRRVGFHYEAMKEALQIENELRCQPPLGEEEVTSIAQSVSRYEPERRRRGRSKLTDEGTQLREGERPVVIGGDGGAGVREDHGRDAAGQPGRRGGQERGDPDSGAMQALEERTERGGRPTGSYSGERPF